MVTSISKNDPVHTSINFLNRTVKVRNYERNCFVTDKLPHWYQMLTFLFQAQTYACLYLCLNNAGSIHSKSNQPLQLL